MDQSEADDLRADCELAARFWANVFSGLCVTTYKEKGEEALTQLYRMMLSAHQGEFFLQGMRKLGIGDDEPPAVRAAKYHYFTNQLGGLTIEYIEETSKKVWIRYKPPMWAFPGISMMAIPGNTRRYCSAGWHARNGAFLGCLRLGYVSTKCILDNEPYDEGYFIEYDHDLGLDETFRFEPVVHTPEYNAANAPRLDPGQWPESRRLKARRNWSREYVNTVVQNLIKLQGPQAAYFMFKQVMRGVAIQFSQGMKEDIGITGDDVHSIANFIFRWQRACGQDFDMNEVDGGYRFTFRSFLPFKGDVCEDLRAALFEFPVMATRLANGRVSVTRSPEGRDEAWDIRDQGRWLW